MPPTSMDVFAAKHFRKILEGGTFKYVFHGTSVTAGHDNWFKDAYPSVVQRLLQPIYDAIEVNLDVKNIAEGNNDCQPHNVCGAAFAGKDVDVISWEQSMNCGRISVPAFVSLLLSVRKTSEAPLLTLVSGFGWQDKKPLTAWSFYAQTKKAENDGFIYMHSVWSAGKYVTEHEFNGAYFKTEKPFGGVKWHPGSHGHRLWGAYHAYHYASFIEEALQKLHETAHQLKKVPTSADMKVPQLLAKYGQNSPLTCDKRLFGEGLCQPTLTCYTEFQPMYNDDLRLANLIEGVNADDLVRQAGQDYKPTIHTSVGEDSTWKLTILPTELSSTLRMKKTNCIDEKWIWAGNNGDGPLVFQLDLEQKGKIVLCSSQGPWGKYPRNWGFLHDEAEVKVDGQVVELEHNKGLCVFLPEREAGHHTLEVRSKSEKYVNIAHLLRP